MCDHGLVVEYSLWVRVSQVRFLVVAYPAGGLLFLEGTFSLSPGVIFQLCIATANPFWPTACLAVQAECNHLHYGYSASVRLRLRDSIPRNTTQLV